MKPTSASSPGVGETGDPNRRITLSVVIPTYNGAVSIRDTIGCISRQTVLPDEIIVVDDCSIDGTLSVVEDLCRASATPTRVLRTRRNSGGPAGPINAGVEAATSDLIAVVEQDDHPTAVRIARSLEAAKLLPSAGLICGRVRMRSFTSGTIRDDLWRDGRLQFSDLTLTPIAPRVYRAESAEIVRSLLNRNIVFTNSNAVFPRSVWRRVGGFDSRYQVCADLDFNLKVAREHPFAIIDEVLCEYLQHDDSLYSRNVDVSGHSRAHFEAALIRMRHALRSYGPTTELGTEWYWEARELLRSAWRHGEWKGGYLILSVLCASGALRSHAMKKLKGLLVSR